jgi:hypothetical protein
MTADLDKLRVLLNSPEGAELKQFLVSELLQLRLIDTIPNVEHPYAKAVALEGQKRAYESLKRTYAKLMELSEVLPTSPKSSDFAM